MAHPPCLQYRICTALKKSAGEALRTAEQLELELLKNYHEVCVGVKIDPKRSAATPAAGEQSTVLPADVYRRGSELIIQVDMGLIPPESAELYAKERQISINATKQAPPALEGELLSREIPRGTLRKTIHLPVSIDAESVKATMKEGGILTITARILGDTADTHILKIG